MWLFFPSILERRVLLTLQKAPDRSSEDSGPDRGSRCLPPGPVNNLRLLMPSWDAITLHRVSLQDESSTTRELIDAVAPEPSPVPAERFGPVLPLHLQSQGELGADCCRGVAVVGLHGHQVLLHTLKNTNRPVTWDDSRRIRKINLNRSSERSWRASSPLRNADHPPRRRRSWLTGSEQLKTNDADVSVHLWKEASSVGCL